jgi:AcrR family transcriptional regulator
MSRSYRSDLRAEQARNTRVRIVDAARERFVESGYGAASIASIAAQAGVATETVYDIFGNKRTLLEAVVDATIRGGADTPDVLYADLVADLGRRPKVRDRVAGFAEHTAATLARMAPMHAVVRSAAAADAALADLPGQIHEMRFRRQALILSALTEGDPALIEGAADTFSALVSPELHYVLVAVRKWPQARYSAWLGRTVVAALFQR